MSAPSPSWRLFAARWLQRGAAAVAGAAFDAVVDSLELGKRCVAFITHSHARVVFAAALVVAVVCATTAAARVVAPSTRAMPRSATTTPRDPSPPG